VRADLEVKLDSIVRSLASDADEVNGSCLMQVSSVLEQCFRCRIDAELYAFLMRRPLPGLLRIVRSEAGIRLYCRANAREQSRLTADQVLPLITYARSACRELLAAVSLAERVCLLLRDWRMGCVQNSVRCSRTRVTRLTHRLVLTVLTRLEHRLLKQCASSAAQAQLCELILSSLLSEPQSQIADLLRQHAVHRAQNFSRRLQHLYSLIPGSELLEDFCWPDQHDYLCLIDNKPYSRVLVSIHMGDFAGAFKLIATQARPGRSATSLRRDNDEYLEGIRGLYASSPQDHTVALHGINSALEIVAALRKGNHTLTALFDLQEVFGETVAVSFFGRPARLVKGPAELAILGRAVILPFVTFKSGSRQVIEMAPLLDTRLHPAESLSDAVQRVTQLLARHAEQWIRRCPAQWQYLDSMPGFFIREDDNEFEIVQNRGHAVQGRL
jgi:lauroyl/myristoyl acyltransferase